jgi:hypothetical protein
MEQRFMRLFQWLAAAGAATSLMACSDPAADTPAVPLADQIRTPQGFITAQPAQAERKVPDARLIPLLTSGDLLPGSNLPWAPTPDGLGAYRDGGDVVVFANHEITATGVSSTNGGTPFQFSRVSRLRIDPFTLHITSGDFVEDGSSGYIRLCSATWAGWAEGFPTGYFFTGEENGATSKGSITLAIDGNGNRTELPQLGALSHENTVAVPGFRHRVVTIGTDDSQGQSELYMYVAANETDFIQGNGKLYVFKTDEKSAAGNPMHSGNLTDGQTISGSFAEISDPADLGTAPSSRYANLQSKVDALGAFPFVRLEDADYIRPDWDEWREPGRATVYFVDTGNETVTGRTQVGADCGGVCDPAGSLYRITLDERDPTRNARLTLVLRSKGAATGWASPDNVGISRRSIMIMEDPAYSGFDGSRAPGIWNASLRSDGRRVGEFREVVQVTQETLIPGDGGKCVDSKGLCWETSGIVSTAGLLGPGTWLFDVQAHTLPFSAGTGADAKNYKNESGQLLYLRLPGS